MVAMARVPRVAWLAGLVAALGAAGCGGAAAAPVGFSCTDRASVERALATAPEAVRLTSGRSLSDCLDARISDADLQSVGLVFHEVAEDLRVQAKAGDDDAATRLGFLVGATTRGAKGTNGVLAELDRRVSLVGGRYVDEATPAGAAALERGLAAGASAG